MKKIRQLFAVLFLVTLTVNAQNKQVNSENSGKNFYDIKKDFEEYWKNKTVTPGSGYKPMMRWIHNMEPRVYPSGNLNTAGPKRSYEEFQKYLQENPTAKQIISASPSATTANWTALGPFGSTTAGSGGTTGAGRVQCIRFHPSGTGTVYVGAAAGGLWKSTNSGASWTTTTDQIASLGVADIVINPASTNIIYIATGDFDGAPTGFSGGDSKSVGVLKSTDGGATWNTTGLTWTTSQSRFISKLLINPLNPVEVFAFTSVGIYRTRNSGTTWSLVTGGYYKDAEYKPGDTTTIYAANGANVYRSLNGGQSFSNVYSSGYKQIRIAVTAADPNYLYVVGTNSSDAFGGLSRSTNSATSFSVMSTTPNILGGTQGWYDLSLAASPTNKDEIVAGGIDLWRSTNGGVSWSQRTFGYGGGPYVHPDQHDAIYMNGTTIWAGHDGGVSMSTNNGSTWSDVNGNMTIGEPYFLGVSSSMSNRIVAGLQDNCSIVWNGTTWTIGKGGDGMDCFIDWNNANIVVASSQNGGHGRSTNGGVSFSNITTGLTGTADWIAPICQDPNTPTTYYAGRQHVFRSTNSGASWSQLGTMGSGGNVLCINPAPSNSNVIYASRAGEIHKTTNGGSTWTNITSGIPVGSAQITDIDVDNTNSNNVYVTLSGYSAGNKVFYSNNGGLSWTNYSTGLPNLPANCIVFKKNSPGAIYVGMDYGVYYRELSMSSFIPYNTGLPNVWVNDMEIYYPTGKLRAATFGRGIWETDLYVETGVVPNAFFSSGSNTICVGSSMTFTDASSNSPTSWSWTFTGGNPGTSSVKNPSSITYTALGAFPVSLVATNSVGASAPYTTTVYVINTPTSVSTSTGTCPGQNKNLIVTSNASNIIWQGGSTSFTATFGPTVTTVYGYTVYSGLCQSTGTATMTVSAAPPTPTFTQLGNILTSSAAPGYQWYLNGSPIPGETNQTIDISLYGAGFYSVWVDNGFGCQASSTVTYLTPTNINQLSVFAGAEISPNPAYDVLNIVFKNPLSNDLSFTVINSLGQTIKTGKITSGTADKISIGLEGFATGLYTLNLYSGSGSINYKFIKQ